MPSRRSTPTQQPLLHSLTTGHALVDGTKRLALLATYVFLDLNGQELDGQQA